MAKYLKQSTASQEIPLGYFVDSTDGNTEETALTIANTDIKLWKNGTTTLANKNSGGATHISNGIYHATLDATDTDTLGPLKVFVHVAGALAFEDSYDVVTATRWDEIHSGTELAKVARATYLVDTTIATLATQTSFTLTAGSADNDAYNGMAFIFTDVTTATQKGIAFASDYVGSTRTVTLEAAPIFTIATTDLVTIVPAGGSTSLPPAVNVTQWSGTAVATPSVAGVPEVDVTHCTGAAQATIATQASVDTIDNFLDTEMAAVLAAVDTEVAAILVDTNELQTDLTNGGRLDLLIDGIKAKTDSLTFTQAGHVDANIQRINDVAITGNGQTGTEFSV